MPSRAAHTWRHGPRVRKWAPNTHVLINGLLNLTRRVRFIPPRTLPQSGVYLTPVKHHVETQPYALS